MEEVVNAFLGTFSNEKSVRERAEQSLNQWAREASFPKTLLQICGNKDVKEHIRLAAAVFFKNLVFHAWIAESQGGFKLSDETKESVKQIIVPATVSASPSVRKTLGEALKLIADKEWPHSWGSLIGQLMPMLSFKDFNAESHRVLGAGLCIRLVCRRYQLLGMDIEGQRRWPIHRMAEMCLGPFLNMLNALVPITTQSSIEMQIIILKIFWSCLKHEIAPVLYKNPPLMKPWMETVVRVLATPIPAEVQPKEREERDNFCWWHLKKWAAKILHRMASHHGVPSDLRVPPENPEDDVVAQNNDIDRATWAQYREREKMKVTFARYFEKEITPHLWVSILKIFQLVPQNVYVSPKTLVQLLRFATFAVRQAQLWLMLEPQVDQFLSEVIFRLIKLQLHEQKMFFEDPVEFVHESSSHRYVTQSPRMQAMLFLLEVSRSRKEAHLDKFMMFLSQRLQLKDKVETEAVLTCLGTVNTVLLLSKKYAPMLESIMEKSVYPEIHGQKGGGPTEWRALWLLGRLWDIKFKNWDNILTCAKNVVHCLQSPYLPTRVMASETLSYIVELPNVAEAIASILPHVIQCQLKIATQIDVDDVMESIQRLVGKYPSKIAPLALDLVPPVLAAYKRAAKEDDDTSRASAQAALSLIVDVVDECAEHTKDPQVWAKLEQLVGPFSLELLKSDDMKCGDWEMGLQLAGSLSFEPPFPSGPVTWALLEAAHASWVDWAKDYMNEISEVWDNFITYGGAERILSSQQMMGAINDVIQYSLRAGADADEVEGGMKMIEICLANFRGKIDNSIGPWLMLLFKQIKQASAEDNEEAVIDAMCTAVFFFFYNPVMTLQMLEKNNLTLQLLGNFFKQAELIHNMRYKKISIVGLSALLHLAEKVPQSVKQMYSQLIKTLLSLQISFWEDKDEQEKLQKAEDEADRLRAEGGEGDEDYEVPEDFEAVPDGNNVPDVYGGHLDDEEFEAYDALGSFDEGKGCHTMEKFDEVVFWAEGINAFISKNTDVFNSIMNSLGKDKKEHHVKLMKLAEEQRKKAAENKK